MRTAEKKLSREKKSVGEIEADKGGISGLNAWGGKHRGGSAPNTRPRKYENEKLGKRFTNRTGEFKNLGPPELPFDERVFFQNRSFRIVDSHLLFFEGHLFVQAGFFGAPITPAREEKKRTFNFLFSLYTGGGQLRVLRLK